ncbi:MAG: PASTA domain-containing protein [Oscillospiraceae bacterium]|nr:PASTA domain-containing protein [Oscillospiraceae bacterium]
MGDTKLCYGCFEPIGEQIKCPVCGFKQDTECSPSYIIPGTKLNNGRYIFGKLIMQNGEGATYLAFDTLMSSKVFIREYMPDALCSREAKSPMINVNHSDVAQYKSLMAEFTELHRKLAKLKTINNINTVLDMFSENNTTYAVYEYVEGVNLIQYLKENAGELNWEQVSALFPPIFTTLSILHNAGIIHRGISPKTIYVTTKGELRLIDFCIAAARTTGNELRSEVFKGYAAPEQYSPSSWQGAWTDVYGICAVLYRILTGCMPTEASLRSEESKLTPPDAINPDIPRNVSNAIMEGLRINGDNRIRTVTELVTRIFEPSEEEKLKTSLNVKIQRAMSATAAANSSGRSYSDSSARSTAASEKKTERREYQDMPVRRTPDDNENGNVLDKIKIPLIIIILLVIVGTILGVFIKNIMDGISAKESLEAQLPTITTPPPVTTTPLPVTEEPVSDTEIDNGAQVTLPPETDEPEETTVVDVTGDVDANIKMIDLVGKYYEDIKMYSSILQYIELVPEYVKSETYEKGMIISQSVAANTWVSEGATVTVQVSKGDGEVEVPSYKTGPVNCYKIEDFLALLDDMGISYRAIPQVNTGYHSGYAIGTEPKAGEILEGGDVLIVHFTDNSGNGKVICSPGVSPE